MATCGIYGVTYKGEVIYVGQSVHVTRRFSQHLNTLRRAAHRNFVLQRIFSKYPDALGFTLIERVPFESLTTREQYWMDELKPKANLSSATGSHLHTEETKQRMRGPKSPEHLARLRALAEQRRGLPNGRRGIGTGRVPRSAFKKGQIPWNKGMNGAYTTSYRGSTLTAEHREKLRLVKLGKPKPESARLALVGRKQPREVIAKRVASFKKTIALRRAMTYATK